MALSISFPGGFTRRQLVEQVAKTYRQIYEEEKASKESSPLPEDETDGKYRIWGHDISELVLEGMIYRPATKTIILQIGS